MAGNPGDPELPGDKSAVPDPPPTTKPRVKTFACPSCGASITLRYPGASMSIVCGSCSSIIDVSNPNYKILTEYYKKFDMYSPKFPLGTRAKLRGKTFEVIGFMVRSDVASKYYWMEYLLFNPYYGYRWLTEDKGNWTLVNTIKRKPEITQSTMGFKSFESANLEYLGDRKFRLYNKGKARVDFVIGEFYWRVSVGSEVLMADYIDPPQMLSMEKNDNEVVWSLSEHIDPSEIEEAFNVKGRLAKSSVMGAIEPSAATANWKKIWMIWVLFLVFLTCAQYFFLATAKNEMAAQYIGNFVPNTKVNDITIPVFNLEKNSANVLINLQAPVSNSWFYVSGELVNDTTGTSYPFEMTSEFYFGTDSDGYWSEGSASHDLEISAVPGGQYYLNIDTESGDFKDITPKQFTVSVRRDVPSFANFGWFAFFLSIMPVWCWALMRRDEVARWANSDYSPYITADS